MHVCVLWTPSEIALFCGDQACLHFDRPHPNDAPRSDLAMPQSGDDDERSGSSMVIDSRLAGRLQRLLWSKNSHAALSVSGDGAGSDTTVTWMNSADDALSSKSSIQTVDLIKVAIVVAAVAVLFAFAMRVQMRTTNLYAPLASEIDTLERSIDELLYLRSLRYYQHPGEPTTPDDDPASLLVRYLELLHLGVSGTREPPDRNEQS